MIVLQHHESEADSIRAALKREVGVACDLVRAPAPIATDSDSTAEVALYRYARKTNGQMVWLIEAVVFSPPDAQWTRSWVVDGEPDDAQIAALLGSNAQAGSRL